VLSTFSWGPPLLAPQDLVSEPSSGGVFVTDAPGALLRLLPNGSAITLAGGGGLVGFSDGPPGAAAYNFSTRGNVALAGLALASSAGGPSGALLISDSGNCRIRAFALDSLLTSTVAGSGVCGFIDGVPAPAAAFALPSGLLLLPATQPPLNTLLFIADTGNHRIRQLTLTLLPTAPAVTAAAGEVVSTLAGTGSPGGVDGPAGLGTLSSPRGLAAQGGSGGMLYVTEGGNRVRSIRVADGWLSTLAGSPTGTPGFLNSAQAWSGTFLDSPWFLSLDESGVREGSGDGILLLADSGNNRIRGVALGVGGASSTLAGFGSSYPPFFRDQEDATGAVLIAPRSIKPSGGGRYWIVEGGAGASIRRLTCGGGRAGSLAVATEAAASSSSSSVTPTSTPTPSAPPTPTSSHGTGSFGVVCSLKTSVGVSGSVTAGGNVSSNGSGSMGRLSSPWGIARSLARDVNGLFLHTTTSRPPLFFIGDSGGHAVRALNYSNGSSSSTIFTVGGTLGVPGFVDGNALGGALFNTPTGVAVNYSDAIYVADTGNHAVRVIVQGVVSTLGGNGTTGLVNGVLTAARFNSPHGISTDTLAQTSIFVADTFNHALRKLHVPSGVWSTLAGNGTADRSADGVVALANVRLAFPRALVRSELSNRIYVADTGNGRILVINTALSTVSTLLGGAPGRSSADFGSGPSALAVLWGPVALLLGDESMPPTLFVSNSGSRTVQSIDLSSSGSVSLLAGGGSGVAAGAWDGWTGAGGLGRIGAPRGLAQDPLSGALLIVDGAVDNWGAGAVRSADKCTGVGAAPALAPPFSTTPQCVVTTLSGTGLAGSIDGAPGLARFNSPKEVVWGGGGGGTGGDPFFYVADEGSSRARILFTNGTARTLGGTICGGITGAAPGFNGSLIVACYQNSRAGILFANGTYSALTGNGTAGYMDGVGSE